MDSLEKLASRLAATGGVISLDGSSSRLFEVEDGNLYENISIENNTKERILIDSGVKGGSPAICLSRGSTVGI